MHLAGLFTCEMYGRTTVAQHARKRASIKKDAMPVQRTNNPVRPRGNHLGALDEEGHQGNCGEKNPVNVDRKATGGICEQGLAQNVGGSPLFGIPGGERADPTAKSSRGVAKVRHFRTCTTEPALRLWAGIR